MHQSPGVRVHGGLSQLRWIHLTQPLKTLDRRLRALIFGLQALKNAALLRFIQRVIHLFAYIDAVKRRHGDKNVARPDQRPEVPQKECADERSNVQPVGISIRQNTDLVITERTQIRATRVNT